MITAETTPDGTYVSTSTTCPQCKGKHAFYTYYRNENRFAVVCRNEDGVRHLTYVPAPAVSLSSWAEFLLRCERNACVDAMHEIPPSQIIYDDPTGPGKTPWNQLSYAIGVIDQKLYRMGGAV